MPSSTECLLHTPPSLQELEPKSRMWAVVLAPHTAADGRVQFSFTADIITDIWLRAAGSGEDSRETLLKSVDLFDFTDTSYQACSALVRMLSSETPMRAAIEKSVSQEKMDILDMAFLSFINHRAGHILNGDPAFPAMAEGLSQAYPQGIDWLRRFRSDNSDRLSTASRIYWLFIERYIEEPLGPKANIYSSAQDEVKYGNFKNSVDPETSNQLQRALAGQIINHFCWVEDEKSRFPIYHDMNGSVPNGIEIHDLDNWSKALYWAKQHVADDEVPAMKEAVIAKVIRDISAELKRGREHNPSYYDVVIRDVVRDLLFHIGLEKKGERVKVYDMIPGFISRMEEGQYIYVHDRSKYQSVLAELNEAFQAIERRKHTVVLAQ